MSEKDFEALKLAYVAFALIGGLSFILIIFIGIDELFRMPADVTSLQAILTNLGKKQNPTPEDLKAALDITANIKELRGASREFWKSVSQLYLLNILIPVLTSILGYLFGSSKK